VIAYGVPAPQAGLASGLSSASAQVGAALGITAFTAVAAAAGASGERAALTGGGFSATFLAAAAVAITAAGVGIVAGRAGQVTGRSDRQ
jgi:hypothetical protein